MQTKEKTKTVPVWFFPAMIIALNLGSSIVYLYARDYRRAVYWIAAAVLTWTVSF